MLSGYAVMQLNDAKLQNRKTAQPQNSKTAKLQNRKTPKPQNQLIIFPVWF
jgi:hypothetical protein